MLHLNNRLLTTFAVIVSAASALLGQPGKPAPKPLAQDDTGTVFRTDTRLVVLPTTVMDKNGHLVTTLPREAFTVLGKRRAAGNQAIQARGRPCLHGTDRR